MTADDLQRRRDGYLPRGRTDETTGAFLAAVAPLLELVDEGFAQLPDVLLLAFLDATGATLLPPSPARTPLVFTSAADAPIDVFVPRDSEVAAVIPPPLPSSLTGTADAAPEPVTFATEGGISVARSRLAAVTSILPATDELARHEQSGATVLFAGTGLVAHHLYAGHDTLFDLSGPAEIALQVGVRRPSGGRMTSPITLAWEYLTAGGWVAFEPVNDQTHGMTVDGEVLLRKLCRNALVKGTVDGVESFWIRARTTDALRPPGPDDLPLPSIDMLRAAVAVGRSELRLDAAYADSSRLDTSKDFLPLGPHPTLGASFYAACDDAFKREGARITLTIEPSASSVATGTGVELRWEYSLGEAAWGALPAAPGELLQKRDPAVKRTAQFMRPADWQPATVNGESRRWLRIRVANGSYGSAPVFSGTALTGGWTPPTLSRLTVAYSYQTLSQALDHCKTLNRFAYRDHSDAARWGRAPFQPFEPVPDREPAVHLGFDVPLPIGLVSLLAATPDTAVAGTAPVASPFTWEYRSPAGWSELSVLDESGGFRRTGLVQFVGQPDHVADSGPDGPLFWVRARLKTATASPPSLPLSRLDLNAVWATHQTSVLHEIVARSDGTPRLTLPLQHGAILPGQRIEVQEWHGAGREWESLFRDVPDGERRFDRDGRERVTGVWVLWHERPHLYSSGPRDRHFTVERTQGVLRFGDGESGMIPPPGAPIAASYRYGGGLAGNVAAGTITQLQSAIPFVASVTNPEVASGGAAAERGDAAGGVRRRGPMQLRHRGRAIRPADLEWLARDASSEVATTRCLPATGPDGAGMPGWVTVVIAPWGEEAEPQPSAGLLLHVREHLARRAPAAIATRIRVVGPRYLAVSVTADVVVGDRGTAARIEEALRGRLARHLHPLFGGPDGQGWEFGEAVRRSHIATVIESTPGVDFADALQLSAGGAVLGDSVPLPAESLPAAGRTLIKLRLGV